MYRCPQIFGAVPQALCRGGSIFCGCGIVLDNVGNLIHADRHLVKGLCLLHCGGCDPLDHCR